MISQRTNPFIKEIISGLDTKIIGKNFYYFETINSTNLFAKKLVKDNVEEGAVVIADIQLRGRGRKNRIWSSPKGGLWFSIILYPNIPPNKGMFLTMTASIAVAQAIKDTTNLDPVIKWPNDVLIKGKKVCGILSEFDADKNRVNYSIVGIGINVNNEIERDLQKIAISLKQEIGMDVSRVQLLRSFLKYFDENYNKMISGSFNKIRDSWFQFSNIIGKRVRVKEEKDENIGTVVDIDENGYLILDTACGKIRIMSGDIEFL